MSVAETAQVSDFRIYIQDEFIQKCKLNPKFSLRAFAQKLQIDPSTLSQVLSGRRPITKKRFLYLSERFSLTPQEHERFLKRITDLKRKKNILLPDNEENNYRDLTIDTFAIISDWYHFAVLELMEIKGFRQEPRWIAQTLGIRVNEVKIAIERLKRVGILQESKNGKWTNNSSQFTSTIGNDFTNRALKKLQKQILTKALEALEEVPLEDRDQSGMLMAIHKRQLPEIKKLIKDFRRNLCSYINKTKSKDAVYQLGISFYPLTAVRGGKDYEN